MIAYFEKAKLSAPHGAVPDLSAQAALMLPGKWLSGSHIFALLLALLSARCPDFPAVVPVLTWWQIPKRDTTPQILGYGIQ